MPGPGGSGVLSGLAEATCRRKRFPAASYAACGPAVMSLESVAFSVRTS